MGHRPNAQIAADLHQVRVVDGFKLSLTSLRQKDTDFMNRKVGNFSCISVFAD